MIACRGYFWGEGGREEGSSVPRAQSVTDDNENRDARYSKKATTRLPRLGVTKRFSKGAPIATTGCAECSGNNRGDISNFRGSRRGLDTHAAARTRGRDAARVRLETARGCVVVQIGRGTTRPQIIGRGDSGGKYFRAGVSRIPNPEQRKARTWARRSRRGRR